MSLKNREIIEKNKASIKRGAYYFGIIGRLSIFFGILTLFGEIFVHATEIISSSISNDDYKLLVDIDLSSVGTIIYGFLFLMARDAFNAVDALTNEMEEMI